MSGRPIVIEDGVVAGNAFDKYNTRNPAARIAMNGFLRTLRHLVRETGAKEVHEVGCGEGHLSMLFAGENLKVRASDFSLQTIMQARKNTESAGVEVAFRKANIYDLNPPVDAAELVICCEVLEHLHDPERALDILVSLAQPHLILSVPQEPIWRLLNIARGKYLRQWGNTPGHLNHWSRRSFIRFV